MKPPRSLPGASGATSASSAGPAGGGGGDWLAVVEGATRGAGRGPAAGERQDRSGAEGERERGAEEPPPDGEGHALTLSRRLTRGGRAAWRTDSVGALGRRAVLAAAILFEPAEDDPDELSRVLALVAFSGGEPQAEGGGEAFEVFDPGILETVGVYVHARAAS